MESDARTASGRSRPWCRSVSSVALGTIRGVTWKRPVGTWQERSTPMTGGCSRSRFAQDMIAVQLKLRLGAGLKGFTARSGRTGQI